MLHIMENGPSTKYRFLKGTEDRTGILKPQLHEQWRFLPAVINDKRFSTWYHLQTVVRFAAPVDYFLAEISAVQHGRRLSVCRLKREPVLKNGKKIFDRFFFAWTWEKSEGWTFYSFPEELRLPFRIWVWTISRTRSATAIVFFIFQRLKE